MKLHRLNLSKTFLNVTLFKMNHNVFTSTKTLKEMKPAETCFICWFKQEQNVFSELADLVLQNL